MRFVFLFLSVCLLLTGCSPTRQLTRDLRTNGQFTDHFTGFALYDPAGQKTLVAHNADKPFVPASNTKLVSFYAGLLHLPDSLPALRYVIRGDSLIFWGTGNPLLLHPDLPDSAAIRFLRSRPERLFFSAANYTGPRFGAGWAWDDYNDDYSCELAPLPLYGNFARFSFPDRRPDFTVQPALFADSTVLAPPTPPLRGARRDEIRNQFVRPPVGKLSRQDVPFRWSPELAAQLLSQQLNRPVGVVKTAQPRSALLLSGSTPTDSLYKRMLQISDNTLAEQILLMASAQLGDTLLTPRRIIALTDSVAFGKRSDIRWVDGSGLSRYNLFSPNSLIGLLRQLQATVPQARLFALLPAAGQSGTLRGLYKTDKPFIFAKSGSMSGVYNLSGYLVTRKGRVLLFSMMHNNFTGSVSEMRQRTARFLEQIHRKF
ncbi:peptidase S13 [Rudanella paleaurantiibacter]|uniref:Peptidase S13 n=1 Tax=Rudanella paleaurantiibacter TaxID=2614655 RepID=A0A7J5U375_9BACT|nr:D-alanyl-D-alanine carboxypeptidase [Rudanella paleaurantiibacter]KAB7732254.1 peptidase S13 [Rudanella paleaurantiibacter]